MNTSTNKNRIKACPWCGETDKRAIIRRGLDGRYFIHHMDAVFNIKSSCGFDTEAEAVDAWEKMTFIGGNINEQR